MIAGKKEEKEKEGRGQIIGRIISKGANGTDHDHYGGKGPIELEAGSGDVRCFYGRVRRRQKLVGEFFP